MRSHRMKLQRNWTSQRKWMFAVRSLELFVVEVCEMICVTKKICVKKMICEESLIESHGQLQSAVGRIGGS